MIFVLLLVLALLAPCAHLLISKKPRTKSRTIELFLLYLLFICIGVQGIIGFIGHTFQADSTAEYIGWPTGNPFQFEVAVANLGFGICGLLCMWIRGDFWTATIIGASIFSLGAAYVHIREILEKNNFAPGNAGPILYTDILIPLLTLGLLMALKVTATKRAPG